MLPKLIPGLLGALMAWGALPCHGVSQSVSGRLIDEFMRVPVASGVVSLVDPTGRVLAEVVADSAGEFRLGAPASGEYIVRARHIGYLDAESPLLTLSVADSPRLEFVMAPKAIPVEGLAVVTERIRDEVEKLGLRLEDLGRRVVTRDRIEAVRSARDIGHVLSWQALPSLRVIRPENVAEMVGGDRRPPELCVMIDHAKRWDGFRQCALFVLDGQMVSPAVVAALDPMEVEAMLLLSPTEAATLYGTQAYGGAVALYTRRGRH